MKFFTSLQKALRGVMLLWNSQLNFRIHVVAGLLVCAGGWALMIPPSQMIALFLVVGGVLVLEGLNTIFEQLLDGLTPRYSTVIGRLKDMMAAIVLIAVFFAIGVGWIIFSPIILRILSEWFIF